MHKRIKAISTMMMKTISDVDCNKARWVSRAWFASAAYRLGHAAIGLSVVIAYLTAQSEVWRLAHILSGYVAVLGMLLRVAIALLGPIEYRLAALRIRLFSSSRQLFGLIWPNKNDLTHACVGRNRLIRATRFVSVMVMTLIYPVLALVTVMGLTLDFQLLSGSVVLEELIAAAHRCAGEILFVTAMLHLSLVVAIRIGLGQGSIKHMGILRARSFD
jgi:hypothetical protein